MFVAKQYLTIFKLSNAQNNKPILVQFDKVKQIRTKNGQNMAFVTLNDGIETLDGVIFLISLKSTKSCYHIMTYL